MSSGGRYRVRTEDERARAFRRAARHSRLVAVLRKGLPVFAMLVLASYFVTSKLSVSVGDMTASIDGIEVSDGNLRMTNPKLEGADKKNGKYSIGAEYADQDMKAPHRIKLHAMRAELTTADGGWSRMNAVRGLFNNRTEKLVMKDKISRRHELGHHRRAQARVARHEEPDPQIASAGLVLAESRQRQGERADLQLRRQHADVPRQGSRASRQASEGRQAGEEAAEGRG